MFIILGGLPGVGKSTIAKQLAKKLKAVYLRIDSIEQAIKNAAIFNDATSIEVVAEGYFAAYAIAKDNLENGLPVIADSVNPIAVTRSDYRNVALATNVPYLEVEIICSDKDRHRQRVENRRSSIADLKMPSWQDVLDRDYEVWQDAHLKLDTALLSVDEAVDKIIENT